MAAGDAHRAAAARAGDGLQLDRRVFQTTCHFEELGVAPAPLVSEQSHVTAHTLQLVEGVGQQLFPGATGVLIGELAQAIASSTFTLVAYSSTNSDSPLWVRVQLSYAINAPESEPA